MTERLEQRYCIKFFQKLGDSQAETILKIQTAFSDDAMGITQIKEWYNMFKVGRTSVDTEPHSSRPSTSQNDHVISKLNDVVMREWFSACKELPEISYFEKIPKLRSTCRWRLHHDNAPVHSWHLTQNFLAKNQIPVVYEVPYAPDMAPCDSWLFPKLKRS